MIGQVGHTYDKNRNVLADGTREFRYNYKNQLRHVWRKSDGDTANTGTLAKYREDAFGRRVYAESYWELSRRVYLDTRFELDVNVDADNDGAAMAPGQRSALPRYVRCANCRRRHHQQPRILHGAVRREGTFASRIPRASLTRSHPGTAESAATRPC